MPPSQRREILDGIREHISAARATHGASRGHERDSDVLNLLEELGTPEEIAAAALGAGDRPAAPPRQGHPVLEIVALLLLSVGSLVVPIVGWLAGVVLLVVFLVLPIVTVAYLGQRRRRASAEPVTNRRPSGPPA